MLKKVLAVTALGVAVLAAPASAASVCYDVNANVNGTVVAQAGCLPPA